MKVVINKCFGGFGLSKQGMLRYAELKGITVYPEKDRFGFDKFYTVPPEKRTPVVEGELWYELSLEQRQELNKRHASESLYDRDIPRDDPALVQVVKELGNKASGRFASLKVVTIPDNISWEIDEYDGNETIAETHRSWS